MLNPEQINTLDVLLQQLVEFLNPSLRCEVEGSLTSSGNLELAFSARDPSDAEYCNTVSAKVVNTINGDTPSGEEEEVVQPVLMQFVSAAVKAPLELGDPEDMNGENCMYIHI